MLVIFLLKIGCVTLIFSHNLPQERISIYNMEVNGKMGFELSNFELSKVFQEPNPYLTQGIPVPHL